MVQWSIKPHKGITESETCSTRLKVNIEFVHLSNRTFNKLFLSSFNCKTQYQALRTEGLWIRRDSISSYKSHIFSTEYLVRIYINVSNCFSHILSNESLFPLRLIEKVFVNLSPSLLLINWGIKIDPQCLSEMPPLSFVPFLCVYGEFTEYWGYPGAEMVPVHSTTHRDDISAHCQRSMKVIREQIMPYPAERAFIHPGNT